MNRYVTYAIAVASVLVMGAANAYAQTAQVDVINPNLNNGPVVIQQIIPGGSPQTINPNRILRGSNVGQPRNATIGSGARRPGKNAGYTTCGGITPNGKVQEACSSRAATFKGRLNKSCPKGSTRNKATNACWQNCPKGYEHKKDGNVVKCRRTDKFAYSPAKLSNPRTVSACSSGATLIKGKCNLCPRNYKIVTSTGRSDKNRCERVLSKWIDLKGNNCPANYKKKKSGGKMKCRRTAKIGYKRANLSPPRTVIPCSSGATLFKGKCNLCPRNYKIVASTGRSDKNRCERALPVWLNSKKTKTTDCKKGEFWDKASGGSCWSCPAQYTRDKFYSGSLKKRPPTNNKACSSIGIVWKSPLYADPGVFGLKGANDVAIDILKNNISGIDEMIKRMATFIRNSEGGTVSKTFAADQWRIIRDNPQDSPALNGAMYYRMLFAALDSGASRADKELVRSFENYIQDRRTAMAQDILNMYDAWKYSIDTKRDMGLTGTKFSGIMNYGKVPPNFQKVLEKSLREQGASPVAIAGMLGGAVVASAGPVLGIAAKVSQSAARKRYLKSLDAKLLNYGDDVDDVVDAVKTIAKGASKGIGKGGKTLKSIAKVGKVFMRGGGGPLIAVSLVSVMIETSIGQFISIQKARPDLLKAVKRAKKKVSVKGKIERGDLRTLMFYWGMGSNAPVAASSSVEKVATAAYKAKGLR